MLSWRNAATFDSPKVAKARLPLPDWRDSFFVIGGDILLGHLVTYSIAVIL